jgi:hypothetical protein
MLSLKRTGKTDVGRLTKKLSGGDAFEVKTKLVFDRQQFEANTMYDTALQREILGLFLQQLEQLHIRLKEGAVSKEDSKFLGHTLRGAATAVGALEFEDIGVNWEKLSFKPLTLQPALTSAEIRFRHAIASYKI